MAKPISNIPILLLPLKLETRFIKDELWIRAFPDEAFLQSHDPMLSQEEKSDAIAFKKHTTKEKKEKAWEELVSKYGVYRSSWLAQIGEEELDPSVDNVKVSEEEPSFHFKWLPDRLVFYLYKAGDKKPTYKADGSVINREGLTVLGDGDDWLQDFDKALDAGMGIKMKIDPKDTKFERVIVSGFRHDNDPLVPAKGLADLFDNHKYTEGFSFLDYGTPTNNTENVSSGHSARDEYEVGNSFDYAVEGLDLEPKSDKVPVPHIHDKTAGKYLSDALGFETVQLKHVERADIKPPLLNELYQKATWFALGAQSLFMLSGGQLSSRTHEDLWQHYTKYVKSKGVFTALKIGKQPYGILPVMNISNVFLPENKDILESNLLQNKMMVVLAHLMKPWLTMAEGDQSGVPRLNGDNSPSEILKILSMQAFSSNYQIRALEYRYFKSKLFDLLKKRPPSIPIMKFMEAMGKEYKGVRENMASLAKTFDLNDQVLSTRTDQFLRAPILSLIEGNTNLVGFQGEKSITLDRKGKTIDTQDQEAVFSLTQDDLGNFQDFIEAIKAQKNNELVQYRGDLSLFTDFFLRGYTAASQLYYRDVVFEPELSDVSPAMQKFKGITILKKAGSTVKEGEPVMVLQDGASRNIEIKAPFDAKVSKVLLSKDGVAQIVSGTPLFTLVNEKKHNEIKNAFIILGEQIIQANNALPEEKERFEAQKRAIGEAVDLNSYRLDAWISSLAMWRLEEMRAKPKYKKGIYFGAYGWIDGLEKDKTPVNATTLTDSYREDGGVIHTPGAAQAVASSVFKNSFLAHKQEAQSNPFTINLSSDRLQKSQFLLDGIRQGQQLEALLGYQLERHLHEDDLHPEIYAMREKYPLHVNTLENNVGFADLSVIDGLKAIKNKDNLPTNLNKIKKHIEKLEDTMDASLDTLFYEAGYQVTQGNLGQAAAALGATKGDLVPPQIESLNTRIPGTGLSHKLVMILPPTTKAYPLENARAFTEPNLEKWLETSLGPMDQLKCLVELYAGDDKNPMDEVTVALGDLQIGYLDFMFLSEDPLSDGASELELRIRNIVLEKKADLPEDIRYVITNRPPENGRALTQALEVVRYAKVLIDKCRPLKSVDLGLEDDIIKQDRNALDDIKDQRLQPLIEQLKKILKSDLTDIDDLALLAKLDFESAKSALLEPREVDIIKLKSALGEKIDQAEGQLSDYKTELAFQNAYEVLQNVAKILFGDSFVLLPPALGSDSAVKVLKDKKQQLLVGDPSDNTTEQLWGRERIENWLEGVAQVHENTELFEDWLMVKKVWDQTLGAADNYGYTIVQGPTLLQYPWVALSKQEIDKVLERQHSPQNVFKDSSTGEAYPLSDGTYYPDNCESTVIYAPENVNLEKPVFGLVIEEFSEHIPDKKMDTGLSFNYNTPNSEPPQALLLAIHPKAAMDNEFFWSEEDLRDILYDTIDLYKIRMVDLEAVQEYGYVLPMTYWFNLSTDK